MVVQFGAHAFIWAAEWSPAGAKTVISGAARAGLDFVEIPLLHPGEFDVDSTRQLLEAHGLGCTTSLGLPANVHLPFNPNGAQQFLIEAVDVSAQIGSPLLTGCVYTHLGTLTRKPPTEEELATVARVLKVVARHAATYDMRLGIEPVNRYESYLINLAAQGLQMLERIDEPNVFLHLDTYHMNIEEKGFDQPIAAAGAHLGYIHLSESDRGIPGTGNVHWDQVFDGLRQIHFDEYLVMESFAAVNEDLIGSTAIWRDLVGDPQKLVTDGLAFLRTKAQEYGLGPTPAES